MRILGIDPGTAITGFGIIDKNGMKLNYVTYGVIRTSKDQPLAERLSTIHKELSDLIAEYKPQALAVELLYFATNVKTAMAVSQARGIVLLCGFNAHLSIAEYTPLQIKQALTNYGRAEKPQIQAMVKTILKLDSIPNPDDAADALAIAICHAARLTA